VLYERTLAKVRKQVDRIETLLEIKTHELFEWRDRYLKMKGNYNDALYQQEKAARDCRTALLSNESLKEQLDDAYVVINRRDAEIKRLQNLLREINQRARPVLVQTLVNRITRDERNATTMKEYRHRLAAMEMTGQPATVIPTNSTVMSPGLTRLLERQTHAIDVWNARKNIIMQQERSQLLATLRGMRLAVPEETEVVAPQRASTATGVLDFTRRKASTMELPQYHPLDIRALMPPRWKTKLAIDPNRTLPMPYPPNLVYDRAVLNASLPNPPLPEGLTRGVVADPIPV
jgi:hypothetical protein